MKIKKLLSKDRAIATLSGVDREVNTGLIEKPKIGDYLLVHAGFAIEIIDKKDAEETLNILKEMEDS